MAGTGSQFYDEKEAEEILRLAAGDSYLSGAMTRERLVATAAELGISEDAVIRAEQQIALHRAEAERQGAEEALFAQYKASRRRSTLSSLGSWVSTSIFLVGIDFLTTRSVTWSIWPVGIWGLFEIGHVVESMMSPLARDERFERWKRKQERREGRREERESEAE